MRSVFGLLVCCVVCLVLACVCEAAAHQPLLDLQVQQKLKHNQQQVKHEDVVQYTLASEFVAFNQVFGTLRMKAHFPTMATFLRATASSSGENNMHLACSAYDLGIELKHLLEFHFPNAHVDTIHMSVAENLACFLLNAPDLAAVKSFAEAAATSSHLKVWEVVPTVIKVHPSTLQQLGIVGDTSSGILRHEKKFKRSTSPTRALSDHQIITEDNMPNMRLLISKTNSRHFSTKTDDGKVKISLATRKLNTDDFFQFSSEEELSNLRHISSHYDDEINSFWASSLHQMEAEDELDACSFAKLDVIQEGVNIEISRLHHLDIHTNGDKACFVRLLAILAADSSTMDIRFRQAKRAFNRYGKGIMETNSYNDVLPYTAAGLNGSGQVIGIGDSGLDESSCYFRNDDGIEVTRSSYHTPTFNMSKRKVVQYIDYADNSDQQSGHGTHVCGTLAGANLEGSDLYNGHASGSKFAFFDMEESNAPEKGLNYPSPMSNFFDPSRLAGANIHSDSWGGPYNFYDADTTAVDAYMYDNDQFLIVFAAGNDGGDGYYSTGDPACSKNALTVGASLNSPNYEDVVWFSSLGPTFDNRIKPDVVAPGAFIFSAKSSDTPGTCSTTGMAGTSMAAPGVAGMAAQVRQYFEDSSFWATTCATAGATFIRDSLLCTNGPFSPRGATVKAVIIHSGESMARYFGDESTREPLTDLNGTPDNYQGFGRVALPNVLPLDGVETTNELYIEEETLFSNHEIVFRIQVLNNSRPLKATIAWIDVEQSHLSHKVLVHDIDLRVELVDGVNTTWYGNKIVGDELNTVEQVIIDNPNTEMDYYVYVTSKLITNALYQKVSIVLTGAGMTLISRVEGSAPARFPSNELLCPEDEMMVTVRMMDRGGDGWESGDFYIITNIAAEVVATGTMGSEVPNDFLKRESLCLPVGKYELTLLPLGDDCKEMTIAVDDCTVYLAGILPSYHSAELDVVANSQGGFDCNLCGGASVPLLLVGSLYGVPYGWVEGISYRVFDVDNEILFEGTLGTGNFEERHFCFEDGSYSLYFNVPSNLDDDFFDDDYFGDQYGIEEYLMQLGNAYTIDINHAISFSVLHGALTNETTIFTVEIASSDDDDAVTELVIIIVVSIVVAICCVIFALFGMGILYCAREKPLTREEVEARYRADIAELSRVENPLHAGSTEVQQTTDTTNPNQHVGSRARRVSIKMSRRFSNFDTTDWKAKLAASKTAEPNPDAAL